MKEIDASICIEDDFDGINLLKKIERAGRTCYKSESQITDDSYIPFINMILDKNHESVLEHEKITVRIICDRGVTHEIVRHRIGSYSQESTRYCNYSNNKFDNQLTFIKPIFWNDNNEAMRLWRDSMLLSEKCYFNLLENGVKPQEARSVLPTSLKSEIVVTYNIREWRHFLKLRTHPSAHPQMQEIAKMILSKFQEKIIILFDNI